MTPALQTQPDHERLKKTHAAQRWRYGNKQKIAKSRREKYLNEKTRLYIRQSTRRKAIQMYMIKVALCAFPLSVDFLICHWGEGCPTFEGFHLMRHIYIVI